MKSDFNSAFPLRAGRVHEVSGPGAHGFAGICCGLGQGAAIWIGGPAGDDLINPVGLSQLCNPGKLLTVRGRNQKDILALAEEALRSPAVCVVVAEMTRSLDLVAARRLQLAAETGGTTGVMIMPQAEAGSNALETRWHCTPVFNPHATGTDLFGTSDSTLQHWHLIKNKTGTIGMWKVRWDAQAHRVIVVSKAGKRPDVAHPDAKSGG